MYKRIKFEIIPEKICVFDHKNIVDQDSTSTCLVRIIKRVKYKYFGKSIWLVEDIENGTVLEVPEYLLSPSGMSIVRNSPNQPQFNDIDLEILEHAIKIAPKNQKTYINRLEALKEKIKVSITTTEV